MKISVQGTHRRSGHDDLLLRETNHRCSNDLQLVVSLLALQSRRAGNPEVSRALDDAMKRVAVLARARSILHDATPRSLASALHEVCEALHAQAEPRSILVAFEGDGHIDGLPQNSITTLALVVNELATNAIKHAFDEGKAGNIRVASSVAHGTVIVTVDDDGLPFGTPGVPGTGMGMGLAKRMMASIDGLFIPPSVGSKSFELRVPSRL